MSVCGFVLLIPSERNHVTSYKLRDGLCSAMVHISVNCPLRRLFHDSASTHKDASLCVEAESWNSRLKGQLTDICTIAEHNPSLNL